MIRPIPMSDMPVSTMAMELATGENWMTIGLRKEIGRRNTPIFELEGVLGRYISHIKGLLKVSFM
jgi:hypothetical protein